MKMTYLKKTTFLVLTIILNNSFYATQDEKYAIFVVGTGRSGTSCAAFILKTLGLNFGEHPTPTNSTNPKGNFEDQPTRQLNEKIMNKIGVNGISIRYINWEKHPHKTEFINLIQNHLKNTFSDVNMFCIKNPQISFLLPLYLEAANNLGYSTKIIVITRDSQQSAKSFAATSSLVPNTLSAYPLLCDCYKSILVHTHNQEKIIIDYDEILYDTEKTINKIRNFIPNLKTYAEVSDEISKFLEPTLQHYK